MRIAVLGSTRGTNLPPILAAIKQKVLPVTLATVISNKDEAPILHHAKSTGIPAYFVNPQGLTREDYDAQVSAILHQHEVDLIVLIGYMRILSSSFTAAWENKIINVHPSLLPAYAGLMDLEVHKAVLAAGEVETGCTVHVVTEVVDAGPAILQKKCLVLQGDTPDTLKDRVQALESDALIEAIHIYSLHFNRK